MGSVLERVEKLESQLVEAINAIRSPNPMVDMLSQKTLGIEQSVISLGKTLTAVVEELQETKVLDSSKVLQRLRKAEDDANRQNINMLVSQNVIEKSSGVVTPTSLVVLSQKIINTQTGEVTVVSGYNLIGMNSPVTSPVWKDSLVGKKINDTVKGMSTGSEEEVLTVLEVYELQDREVQGEQLTDEISFDGDTVEEKQA